MKYNVHYHLICENNENILEYAIPYWKLYASHVFIYLFKTKNDNSEKILEKYKDFITIFNVNYDVEKYDGTIEQKLINNSFKASKGRCDFCFIGKVTDILYFKNVENTLDLMHNNKCTIYIPNKYEILDISGHMKSEYIHESIFNVYFNDIANMSVFLNPNEITELNYDYITGNIDPVGNIKFYRGYKSCILDVKYMLFDDYLIFTQKKVSKMTSKQKKQKANSDYNKTTEELTNIYKQKQNNLQIFNLLL